MLRKRFCAVCIFITDVVDNNSFSAQLQNAPALAFERVGVKPVKGLGGGYKINAFVGKCSIFAASVYGYEALIPAKSCLRFSAHIAVGLHRENLIAPVQQLLGENPGSGADVRKNASGDRADCVFKIIEKPLGVFRTRLCVYFTHSVKAIVIVHFINAPKFGYVRFITL